MNKRNEMRRPTLPVIEEYGSKELGNDLICKSSSLDNDENGNCLSDLTALKAKAMQLKLSTRRESYLTWKHECVDYTGDSAKPKVIIKKNENADTSSPSKFTSDKKERINDAILWIRSELQAMRVQDQDIARQLLTLRTQIHELKLKWSCEEHQDMIEDVQCDLDEMHVLQEFCDLPEDYLLSNPFKHIGVTKMNLNSRRFSIF